MPAAEAETPSRSYHIKHKSPNCLAIVTPTSNSKCSRTILLSTRKVRMLSIERSLPYVKAFQKNYFCDTAKSERRSEVEKVFGSCTVGGSSLVITFYSSLEGYDRWQHVKPMDSVQIRAVKMSGKVFRSPRDFTVLVSNKTTFIKMRMYGYVVYTYLCILGNCVQIFWILNKRNLYLLEKYQEVINCIRWDIILESSWRDLRLSYALIPSFPDMSLTFNTLSLMFTFRLLLLNWTWYSALSFLLLPTQMESRVSFRVAVTDIFRGYYASIFRSSVMGHSWYFQTSCMSKKKKKKAAAATMVC